MCGVLAVQVENPHTICEFPLTFPVRGGFVLASIIRDTLNLNSGTFQGHVSEN